MKDFFVQMIIADVRTNPKIGTLLPWLVCFIRNGMQRHCENKTLMFRLLSLLQAVFSNSTLNLSPKPYVSVFHIFIQGIKQAFFSTFSSKLSRPKTPKISKLRQNFCQNSQIFAKTRKFLFKTQFSGKIIEFLLHKSFGKTD